MKNNVNAYRVVPLEAFNKDFLTITFQSFYANYVNENIQGDSFVFQYGDIYVCFILRKKNGFTFAYLISELFSINTALINYELFYSQFECFLKEKSVIAVLPPQHLQTYKLAPRNSKSYRLGIIELDLKPSLDEIFIGFKPVYRRHIRNAKKDGVIVEFGVHLFDEFYTFYETRMLTNNAIYDSKAVLKKMIDKAPENVVCAVAKLSNNIEAVILNIHDDTKAYYMWGASSQIAHNGSFRLLHWELIQFYHSIGLYSYSLGGYRSVGDKSEKQEKLESFKIGFGAKINEGFHFIWLLKPFQFYIYSNIAALLKRIRK